MLTGSGVTMSSRTEAVSQRTDQYNHSVPNQSSDSRDGWRHRGYRQDNKYFVQLENMSSPSRDLCVVTLSWNKLTKCSAASSERAAVTSHVPDSFCLIFFTFKLKMVKTAKTLRKKSHWFQVYRQIFYWRLIQNWAKRTCPNTNHSKILNITADLAFVWSELNSKHSITTVWTMSVSV